VIIRKAIDNPVVDALQSNHLERFSI
jgi:hypothetical protein